METEEHTWAVDGEQRWYRRALIELPLERRLPGLAAGVRISGFDHYDGGRRVDLSFYGPRGGYRYAIGFELEESDRLRARLLTIVADRVLGDDGVYFAGKWNERLRVTAGALGGLLDIYGPRGTHRVRASMLPWELSDLAAALRFVREYLEAA